MEKSVKLIVADDAPFIREIVRQIVTAAGIELIGEATNGEEAIEIILGRGPDVVLMDIVMPRKSGIEATKEILRQNKNIRIIACSTVDQESMILQAIEAGCCSYVVKPFKAEDLVKSIRSAAQL